MHIAFLWHMHQPFYKDLFRNEYIMPWTFLHAIKDYNDMIEVVNEFENVKVTFNFVPSLIAQILDYSDSLKEDYFLNLLIKPVSDLTDQQKTFILRQLFSINYDTMVVPLKRFRKLYEKKDFKIYSNDELLDLEVLYLLAWSGYYIKKDSEVVKNLTKKAQNFTEDDKLTLLDELHNYIKSLLPKYKKAFHNNKIEISTSPYYHPILPLLLNFQSAKIAMPYVKLPKINNTFREDANLQIEKAKTLFKNIFEKDLNGMWPSEGSVSPEVTVLVNEHNISWIATDEDILFRSLKLTHKRHLYYPYENNNVKIFFRDKDLSNLIGFIYSKWNYKDAAKDFYNRLKNIQQMVNDENAIVPIILDGENAWEYYEENGIPFLREMYQLIEGDSSLKFTTFSEYLNYNNNIEKLSYLHSGSWINSSFQIWIGHPEENQAWEFVDNAKSTLLKYNEESAPNYNLAKEELLIAEGSDWYWWYGDDFYSEFSDKFDILFRTHIANVYSFLNEDIPSNVLSPIKKIGKEKDTITQPLDIINPTIDGYVTDYFEWISAGLYQCDVTGSTMAYEGYYLSKIYFGFNEENLFFRIDAVNDIGETFAGSILELNIHNKTLLKIEYDFSLNSIKFYKDNAVINDHNIKIACNKIIEISIPFNDADIQFGEEISMVIEIIKNKKLIDRIPYNSAIKIKLPENLKLEYWTV
jgi:alpha-amylase/alpha-mannosidase (GH57 family)